MANRSYLYACSSLPTADRPPERVIGISEWNYAIPLVPLVLVSADVQACPSMIWPGETALAGLCDEGIRRLDAFLARIAQPDLAPMHDEALAFLTAHRDAYFVLEIVEVLTMGDLPVATQAERLLQDVRHLDAQLDASVADLSPQPASFWTKLFKPSKESLEEPLRELGLGYWSTTLWIHPGSQ